MNLANNEGTDQRKGSVSSLHKEIIATYVSGSTLIETGQKFGMAHSTIFYILEKNGVPRRKPADWRKHTVNTKAFKTISTELQAYWLGFLIADGCIVSRGNRKKKYSALSVVLAEKDKEHLCRLRAFLGSTSPVRIGQSSASSYSANSTICQLRIFSTELCSDLVALGVIPRKSYGTKINGCPTELRRHYIRGLFDGDGTIVGLIPKGYRTPRGTFRIISHETILAQAQHYLMEDLGLSQTKLQPIKNNAAKHLQYSGINQLKRIHNYLYDEATIWLPRKKERFQEIMNLWN